MKRFPVLMRVLSESRKSSAPLILIAGLSLLSLPLTLLYPLPLRLVVDNVLSHRPLPPFLASATSTPIAGSNLIAYEPLVVSFSIDTLQTRLLSPLSRPQLVLSCKLVPSQRADTIAAGKGDFLQTMTLSRRLSGRVLPLLRESAGGEV